MHDAARGHHAGGRQAVAAALIGRIGGSGVFFVGSDRGDFRMRDSGRLYLSVNDDYLQDNSGAFRVTVYD